MTRARLLRRRLEDGIERLRELEGRRSRWSEMWAYRVNGREILHFHGDDELDIRLSRAVLREHRSLLESDPRVRLGGRRGDWVEVTFTTAADVPFVLDLVKLAVAANRRGR